MIGKNPRPPTRHSVVNRLCLLMLISGLIVTVKTAAFGDDASSTTNSLQLASLISDRAVLQRDVAVPIWGRAKPGSRVVVMFAGQEKATTSTRDGLWTVKLDPLTATSNGRELAVVCGDEVVRVRELVVGEVWLFAGSADWLPRSWAPPVKYDTRVSDSQLRMFEVRPEVAATRNASCGGEWQSADPTTLKTSAQTVFQFGAALRKHLGVPLGLVSALAKDGCAEAWVPQEILHSDPAFKPLFDRYAQQQTEYPRKQAAWQKDGEALLAKWHDDDNRTRKAFGYGSSWPKPTAPIDPENSGQRPSGLFNGTLAPLMPYRMRGVVWLANRDQAEPRQALLKTLIPSWHREWSQGVFPFLIAHTPRVLGDQGVELWSSQMEPLPPQSQVISLQHRYWPKFHERSGYQLSMAARTLVYADTVEYSGPQLQAVRSEGKRIILSFTHVGGGLVKRVKDFEAFQVRSQDGRWKKANAEIIGDTVVVSNDDINEPIGVAYDGRRYASLPRAISSEQEPELWNAAGFPAAPFVADVNASSDSR